MSRRGQLLIAQPRLADPNFLRTVVLIVEHTDEGAMGLVLNRPADALVVDVAPDLAPLAEPDDVVHIGGPVGQEGLLVLAEFDEPEAAARLVTPEVGLVAADADFAAVAGACRRARVFAGHAGWAPGQLEAELDADGWIVEAPAPDEPLTEEPERLWAAVLERKGGQFALLARMPLDPSVN